MATYCSYESRDHSSNHLKNATSLSHLYRYYLYPFETNPASPPIPSLSSPVSHSSTAPLPLIQFHLPSSSPSYPSNFSSGSSHAHSRTPAAPDRHFAHNTSQSSRPCPRRNRRRCCSRLKGRTRFLARRSQSRRRCGSRRSFRHRSSLRCRIRSLGTEGQSSRRWRRSRMGTTKLFSFPSLFLGGVVGIR